MEVEAEVLEPLELRFTDLLLLSSPSSMASCSPDDGDEHQRLQSLSAAVMLALGPSGPGLLSITGVPRAPALRRALLPLSRKLALLDNKVRARILKDHGLGSDVPLKKPDRSVSSFATQLKYEQHGKLELSCRGADNADGGDSTRKEGLDTYSSLEVNDDDFKHLGDTFKELGLYMMGLGLRLAQVCDKAIGGRELEESVMGSGTAKGRLIHYHSKLDSVILKDGNRKVNGGVLDTPGPLLYHGVEGSLPQVPMEPCPLRNRMFDGHCCRASLANLWQQWHYDYGIFTVLTAPMFLSSCQAGDCFCDSSHQECLSRAGHTYLQLFDSDKSKILVLKSPPESFIIQVGESADILSRGKLRSSLHSVSRPVGLDNLSRETFVVFLQPAWNKVLSLPECLLHANHERVLSGKRMPKSCKEDNILSSAAIVSDESPHQSLQEIWRTIPPLSSRLRDGMTFAEFSRETTKQYYGASGTQSQR
ncbi:hypothetical protein J5N97_009913 [Dioscorea zingiberensis]|uniref:Isopenicillin N synthase-like Fe(2+) 2OG dioxygenase domain-containing protein n=1 Tax=Dioscorea zingiberensis TaxID=325984 RepID=A0A9D5CYG1_9LILI|nr:hypothetical protein J5N97_009913 [Dioscorea zingiberensis]